MSADFVWSPIHVMVGSSVSSIVTVNSQIVGGMVVAPPTSHLSSYFIVVVPIGKIDSGGGPSMRVIPAPKVELVGGNHVTIVLQKPDIVFCIISEGQFSTPLKKEVSPLSIS